MREYRDCNGTLLQDGDIIVAIIPLYRHSDVFGLFTADLKQLKDDTIIMTVERGPDKYWNHFPSDRIVQKIKLTKMGDVKNGFDLPALRDYRIQMSKIEINGEPITIVPPAWTGWIMQTTKNNGIKNKIHKRCAQTRRRGSSSDSKAHQR